MLDTIDLKKNVRINETVFTTQKQSIGNILRIFGTKRYDMSGKPNIACYVIIEKDDGTVLKRDVTDSYGYYEFVLNKSDLSAGYYYVKFYGSSAVQKFRPDGDWEVIEIVPADLVGAGVEPIVFVGTPTMDALEATVDVEITVSKDEFSYVLLEFDNLQVVNGDLSDIIVYFRRQSVIEDPTAWKLFASYKYGADVAGADTGTFSIKSPIELYAKPSEYDFYAIFVNAIGDVAVDTTGDVIKAFASASFGGVTEIPEYISVENLVVTNAIGKSVIGQFIRLDWLDYRDLLSADFPRSTLPTNGYNGSTYSISYVQAQRITHYACFMYVSDINKIPSVLYPNNYSLVMDRSPLNENTNWFYMGEVEKSNIEVRCPTTNKYVGFWIGAGTDKTPETSDIIKNFMEY